MLFRSKPKVRFPIYFDNWKKECVKSFGEIITGNTPSKDTKEYWHGETCWISAQDFLSKYICTSTNKLTKSGRSKARIIPPGNLLITCIASIGLNAINNIECATNQQINSIIVNQNNNVEFLYYLFNNNIEKMKTLAGVTAVSIINKSSLSNMSFFIPSLSEQIIIGSFLKLIDTKIEISKKLLETYQQQKLFLLKNMFI